MPGRFSLKKATCSITSSFYSLSCPLSISPVSPLLYFLLFSRYIIGHFCLLWTAKWRDRSKKESNEECEVQQGPLKNKNLFHTSPCCLYRRNCSWGSFPQIGERIERGGYPEKLRADTDAPESGWEPDWSNEIPQPQGQHGKGAEEEEEAKE